ncbi:MAG: hypothetical protein IJ600_06215 [Lachnospiraceae bacterium]|nr:hypothetical protein [Lachnospiraceae bacterium]
MKSDSIQADETRQHQENIEQHNRDMEITEKKQLKYQRLSFICSFLSMLFMGAVLAIVIMAAMYLGPRVETIYNSTMVSLENLE